MSTDLTLQIHSENSDASEKVGQQLGSNLKGGECIELISDVGGGKTTFTRGIARGAGSKDHVSSPTFTISNIYKTPKFEIHHFDFYRLHEAGLMQHELADVLQDPEYIIVVEWSDVAKHVLPEERVRVHIKTLKGEEHTQRREFTFTYPEKLGYIFNGVQ